MAPRGHARAPYSEEETLEQRLARQLTAAIQHHEEPPAEPETPAPRGLPEPSFDDQVFSQIRSFLVHQQDSTQQGSNVPLSQNNESAGVTSFRSQPPRHQAVGQPRMGAPPSLDIGGMDTSAADAETLRAVQAALMGAAAAMPPLPSLPTVSGAPPATGGFRAPPASRRVLRGPDDLTEEDKERIREENRARKRRWRDAHIVQNRDNDLRARIQRRATQIFGDSLTQEKSDWVETEFRRRREKRLARAAAALSSSSQTSKYALSSDSEDDEPVSVVMSRPISRQTKSIAGVQLSKLFKESNSILQWAAAAAAGGAQNRVSEDLPPHVAPHIVRLSPARPSFRIMRRQDRVPSSAPNQSESSNPSHQGPSQWQPRKYDVYGPVCLGMPPNLVHLSRVKAQTE